MNTRQRPESHSPSLLPLADALRAADCPPPQTWLGAEWQALGSARRGEFETHLADCAACQAERGLAEAFDLSAAAESTGVSAARPGPRWAGALAAAIGLCALGLSVWFYRPDSGLPPLPARDGGARVTRGTSIALVEPNGELASAPAEFRWTTIPEAARYTVTVRNVAGEVVWTQDSATSTVRMPQPLGTANVRRFWVVTARGANDQMLARSHEAAYIIKTEETR